MYVPRHFASGERAELHALMREFGFAVIVTGDGGRPYASHLPFALEVGADGRETLYGHVARANPHWRAFDGAREALVVFQGAHAYVSPSWYETRLSVPTWNYEAVHAYGRPLAFDGEEPTLAVLKRLVALYESEATGPWRMESLPDDYLRTQLKGIVAFEMPVERLEGKLKMSQNKSAADRAGVIRGLKSLAGDPLAQAVAERMQAREERG
jgi:transcriptional regulator